MERTERLEAKWAGTLGSMVTWLWPILIALSFATTCTMGDDGSRGVTLLLCTCVTLVALPLLLLSRRQESWRWIRLSVVLATALPLLLTVRHAMDTAVWGHHLCGPGFDGQFELLPGDRWRSRFFYPVLWAEALALIWAARRRPGVSHSP
jgi:hypothetical protein